MFYVGRDSCKYCNIPEEKILHRTPVSFIMFGSQLHPGHVKIIYREHVEDIRELPPRIQNALWSDVMKTARAVDRVFRPDRLNYQLLGNWEPHIHWHIYPRYRTDPDWGQPPILHWKVDGRRVSPGPTKMKEIPLAEEQAGAFKEALKKEFS